MKNKVISFIWQRKIFLASLIFLFLLGFFGFRFFAAKKQPKIQTTTVKRKDIGLVISASGEIKSEEEATLRFQTSGQLAWVGVKKGDKVKKWQAVASINIKELEKTLHQELLDYMNERWDYEQTNLDTYKDAALSETIRRAKEKAQFDLDRTVLDVEIADIALKYSTLVSPIDGIVTEITCPYPGINVYFVSDKIVITSPEKLYFSASIDEIDIAKIKTGQQASLLLDAYPDEQISTSVHEVDFTATTTSGGGTAFNIKFLLPPNTENEKFKLGMNGDVEVFVEERKDVLSVPVTVVSEGEENGTYVWVLKDNTPVVKPVTTGISDDINIEIVNGLGEGELIITSGFKELEKLKEKKK